MKRDMIPKLIEWKNHPLRKPLILRGARQVGKSWLVREFGKQFDYYLEINFEKDKEVHALFPDSIDINKIINNLNYYSGIPIKAKQTLVFLDEIQDCQNALRTLRYFKEDYPDLHVIAAGSLLDFAIEKYGLPVGRIQFLYLYPLSFAEFLTAINKHDLRELLLKEYPATPIHKQLLEYVKIYSITGGMPDVISAWLTHGNIKYCQDVQDAMINTYRQDFEKYAESNQIEYVSTLFDKIPDQLGKKFIYSHIDQHISHYHIRQAVKLLAKAGIIYYCYHSSGQGHPLGAGKNLKKFKIFFFDIGLAQRLVGLDVKDWLLQTVLPQHDGAMAEQYVAQQLVAHSSISSPAELYYWHREAKGSNAEVDFIHVKKGHVIPIEVKSGSKGHLKSMHLFLDSHPRSEHGLKVSSSEYSKFTNYEQIPYYALESWLLHEDR